MNAPLKVGRGKVLTKISVSKGDNERSNSKGSGRLIDLDIKDLGLISVFQPAHSNQIHPYMFNIVLVHPEIPPNTGNVIRLCANTGCSLHLIEPLGFHMTDPLMRRAGLDYHEYAKVKKYVSWQAFLDTAAPNLRRCFALTTKGTQNVFSQQFKPADWLFFGSETKGLPVPIRESFPESQRLLLPMLSGQRSLNLSNSVAIVAYEAWRQNDFAQFV